MTLAGEDGLEINLLYLDDATEVIHSLAIASHLGSPFTVNAGHMQPATIRDIAESSATVLGCEPHYEQSDDEALSLTCDTSRLRNIYTPAIDLKTGIRNAIERDPVIL